jgi:hypothetical protein
MQQVQTCQISESERPLYQNLNTPGDLTKTVYYSSPLSGDRITQIIKAALLRRLYEPLTVQICGQSPGSEKNRMKRRG